MKRIHAHHLKHGFTLAELLVVLAILAVLTMAAVQSLAPVAQQSRMDGTLRSLNSIRSAIVDDNSASGVSGFVADVGRLPQYLQPSSGTTVDPLVELYLQPASVPSFVAQSFSAGAVTFPAGTVTFPASPSPYMTVPRGWRGPYLQAPAGATALRDGWGNVLTPIPAVTDTATSILGALSTPPSVDAPSTPVSVSWANDCVATSIVGTVKMTASANNLYPCVLLFYPQADAANPVNFAAFSTAAIIPASSETPISYTFSNVVVGPRAVCAAYATSTPATSYTVVGSPIYFNVRPRVTSGPSWSVSF